MLKCLGRLLVGCGLLVGVALASAAEPAAGRYALIFGIGLHDEGSWTPVGQSDGMTFAIEVRDGQTVKRVFEQHKAKEHPAPEYFTIDLSPWGGKAVALRFIADPGPRQDAAYDWGVWIEPRVVKGTVAKRWWLDKSGVPGVIFDAIDAYGTVATGVGDEAEMRAGAQFNPGSIPVGWNVLPWAEKYCGKVKVRGILHEPAWDNEATASWAEYVVPLGGGTVAAVQGADLAARRKKMENADTLARRQLIEAKALETRLAGLIRQGRERGLQMRLPRVTAAVLQVFIPRATDDLDGVLDTCSPCFPGWYYNGGKAEFQMGKAKMREQGNKWTPEFIAERQQRGFFQAGYLVTTAKQAIGEAETILADPATDVKYPDYNMGKLTIRDGYFYDGETPALLAGLYTNRDVRNDYGALSEMGVCFTQPERLNVFTTLLSEKETNRAFIDGYVVRDTLVPAGKADVGCLFDLGLHYMPDWAYKKYPGMTNPGADGNHYAPYLVTSPDFRRLTKRYLDELIPTTAKYPMTTGYEMGNQPFLNPWSPEVIARFQTWAKTTYRTIGAANAKWGSAFKSFADVQPDKNFRKIEPLGLRYDWINFQHGITSEWYRWLKAELNRRDPGRPVTVQPAGNFFEPQKFAGHDAHRVAIDYVDLYANITDISGFDACTWYWGRLVFDQMGTFVDLLRSLAPDKPVVNFEYAMSMYGSKTVWDPGYIRASLWYSYLHGMGGGTSWIWNLGEITDESQNHGFSRWADRAEQFGRTALELRRFAPEITRFGRAPAEVAILYSSPSLYFAGTGGNEYCEQARAVWSAASFLDAPLDFVSDEQIAKGALGRYKLLIVPASPYLQDGTRAHLLAFVKRGGVVVANTGSFAFDAYGKPWPAMGLLGGHSLGDGYRPGTPVAGKAYGRGMVHTVEPMAAAGYYPILDTVYQQAGVFRPVRVRLAHDRSAFWTVELRTVREKGPGNHYLFYCFNVGNRTEEVRLACPKGFVANGHDLIGNRPFAKTFALKPLELCIWRGHVEP